MEDLNADEVNRPSDITILEADTDFQINPCQSVEPHKDSELIKSNAVVKFSAVQVPAQFTRLQCNTDLNMPPSNWLSNSANSYGLQQFIYHSNGFESFRMAHKFPDCLGEVDVVSDAENIKNLLKLPYSPKNAISMMVHRIGNTLLIDEFDLQKYLLRQADDDWKWLRTFIVEHILSSLNEKDRGFFCIKDKSRGAIQRKNLLSKFLYHSLQHNIDTDNLPPSAPIDECRPLPLTGPVLPEANIEENVPDPHSNHDFNRNVVWTFEDIRMLIGTDMPIFGGVTRPCISLRLRDMAKPISVLTGIDYWLDNLMCNVPEVVMCYHLDGIVQKYEIIKTEDLPYLEDSTFSPQLVRNVAQNILAFLKANATKAGHTYWLFKGKNDDVVKLYDLTTLCQDEQCDEKSENPFTVPVAMLLYTVARNMRNASDRLSNKKAGSIKTLLENCIQLLQKEKYPQIVTSSHYILSDLHIPSYIDPKQPDFDYSDDEDSESFFDDDFEEFDGPDEASSNLRQTDSNVTVKQIRETLEDFKTNMRNNKLPQPLIASTDERCKEALENIRSGLDCLQYFALNEEEMSKKNEERAKEEERQRIIHEEQHPNMAKPFQPIPLPYEPLKSEPKMANPNVAIPMEWSKDKPSEKRKKKTKHKGKSKEPEIDPEAEAEQRSLIEWTQKIGNCWNVHLKLLLLEKACLTYATLAEYYYDLEHYGKSLHCIYMGLKCQKVVTTYVPNASSQRNCLMGRAGDVFFQLSKRLDNIKDFIVQFHVYDKIDDDILAVLEKDLIDDDEEYITPMENLEGLLLRSIRYYALTLKTTPYECKIETYRRLGSVSNELALKYMHWGKAEYDKFMEATRNGKEIKPDEQYDDEMRHLYEKLTFQAYDYFIKSVRTFEQIKDNVNLTFVHCNLGRFFRYRAHIHMTREKPGDLRNQKKFYNEAFLSYKCALVTLGSRESNPELHDAIEWDLATATFSLAQLLQDNGDSEEPTAKELDIDIHNFLQESLKFCMKDHAPSHELLYKYRAALIHNRLAELHQNNYIRSNDDAERKRLLSLASLHYGKATDILAKLNEVTDFIKVHLKHVNLMETVAEENTGIQRAKAYQQALAEILKSQKILNSASEQDVDISKVHVDLLFLEDRLKRILLALTKFYKNSASTTAEKMYNHYKNLYAATLNSNPRPTNALEFLRYFVQELDKLNSIGAKKK